MVLYTDFLRGCVEMSRILQRGRVWHSGRAGGRLLRGHFRAPGVAVGQRCGILVRIATVVHTH